MPKKKSPRVKKPLNKAAAIREYKEKHPDALPKEITEVLNRKGYEVNPQYVSMILSVARKKAGTSKPRKLARSAAAMGDEFTLDQLMVAKRFIGEMGGVDRAQAAVDAVAELARNDKAIKFAPPIALASRLALTLI